MLQKILPSVVAAAALVGYVVFVVLLLDWSRSASEQVWLRATYVFAGVESLAFAAGGFLFGHEINRARREAAEVRADAATASGQALSGQIRALADQGYATREGGSSALLELARQAERLFPRGA